MKGYPKMVINDIYRIAKQTKGSIALQKACLRALTAKPNMKRKANQDGNSENHEQALLNLSTQEQKEVKVGVLSEVVKKVVQALEKKISTDALETFKSLIKETGLANKIRRGEKIITAPSNPLEKKISEKAKSFASVSDSIAFLGRLTQAESPEEIVIALDISMEEFESNLSVILGEKITGLVGGGWRKLYSSIAEITSVFKLFTVELGMTILELSIPNIIAMALGGGSLMSIFSSVGHAFEEVFFVVILAVLLLDLKDAAQFIRKQDILIKSIPIIIVNDIIRVLKWSWNKITAFFSNIVKDTVEFFEDWFGSDQEALPVKVAVFRETLRLASVNPVFHQRVLEVLV